jgi:U3 small nucleolar RNA-associated protein 22
MEALQDAYEDSVVFFQGDQEDLVIGGLWNPKIHEQNFRAGLPYNMLRVEPGVEPSVDENDKVDLNRRAVLLEIGRIGGELIRKIEEL